MNAVVFWQTRGPAKKVATRAHIIFDRFASALVHMGSTHTKADKVKKKINNNNILITIKDI